MSASSKNAQKIALFKKSLPGTPGKDPNFGLWRGCGDMVAATFSRDQQYASHSTGAKKILATRQGVARRVRAAKTQHLCLDRISAEGGLTNPYCPSSGLVYIRLRERNSPHALKKKDLHFAHRG